MNPSKSMPRRAFLQVGALASGGLLVACSFGSGGGSSSNTNGGSNNAGGNTSQPAAPDPSAQKFDQGAFIRISEDNFITVVVAASEMGQGTVTSMPMMLAEELDADWERVTWEQSPASTFIYANPFWLRPVNDVLEPILGVEIDQVGLQVTAASTTIRGYYGLYRQAGAAVRSILVQAAADRLGVGTDSLRTEKSHVIHDATGVRLSYGELAQEAAQISPPARPELKDPSQFQIIGQSFKRVDGQDKSQGSQEYGMDVKIPGMLTAVVERAPVFGGRVQSFDASAALQVPGVESVHEVPSGIAVVAKDYWSAQQGRKALDITWNTLLGEKLNTSELGAQFKAINQLPGRPAHSRGLGLLNPVLNPISNAETLEAEFEYPYLAHAPMEPLNVVIDYRGNEAEIWCGTQWPDLEVVFAGLVLGLLPTQITFHTLMSGGAFGRRANILFDYIQEAAHVAKAVQQPVKIVWSREDDIRGGYYRPFTVCSLKAGLDNQGNINSWNHRIARQSLALAAPIELGVSLVTEELVASQGATEMPYEIPNVLVDIHNPHNGVPVLWMRSVANAVNVYAIETFMDQIANHTGKEPYAMRRDMLQNNPRQLAVLDAVAQMCDWYNPPAGVFRGIATFTSYDSHIAQVVDLRISEAREVELVKVYSAVDCGIAINPDLVKAQTESGISFALSSTLFGEISLEQGEVQQSNFHDYLMLRMNHCPAMETQVLPSTAHPGGVGELGVPCVAPALSNALYAATGETFRSLPLSKHNLSFV